ncbi:MAG: thioesterase family protein [Actinobacteria bacterium]|nr:thioesterase family protein [Actinomycetota bacterium]
MDARRFLGLAPTHNDHRWYLPIVPGICTGHMFLFGGSGLGAAIEALEGTTGRPLIWATAQYLSYANPPSIMDIDVTVPVTGKAITQARAVAHVADREILTVNAALGHRDLPASGAWPTPPDVPRPAECERRTMRFEVEDSINQRMETRLALGRAMDELDGTPSDGRCALWGRIPELTEPSAASLAILGDFVPFGIGQALGERAGGNSLDNTLRIARLVPTEWVLVDIRVDAVANGFGHGSVYLWAEDGTLMATASQSAIVRYWRDEAPPVRDR